MVRLDGRAIDAAELQRLAGDPVETWIDAGPQFENQARILRVTPSVALGYLPSQGVHHRLRGEQPWLHPETAHAITADAQLDNRQELCAALQLEPGRSDHLNDGQLILLAWLQWGEACLHRLQGDFAFALWDPLRQCLFCVRDRLGATVLGFVKHRDYFAFASDSEWLVRLPGLTGRPSITGIAELIDWRFPMLGERATWRDEVQIVLPGEILTVTRDGSMTFRTWWAVEPVTPLRYGSDDEMAQDFLAIFGAAVERRLGEPQAAMLLSGGLDSLAIACAARNVLPPAARLATYSCVYDGGQQCIESESIFSLIDSLQANARVIGSSSMSGSPGGDDLLRIAWSRPHPMESSLLAPALCCLKARRSGDTAMLHGVSGDIVSGIPWLYMMEYFRSWHWLRAVRECVGANANNVYLRNRGLAWIISRSLSGALLPLAMRKILRRLGGGGTRADVPSCVMHQNVQQEYLREKAQTEAKSALAMKPFPALGMASLYSGLSGFGRLGRRFGIRMRDPWADVRVLQFFLALPLQQKVRQGWTKYPVRRAFGHAVKPEVMWRRDKEHVGWRFTQQLMVISDEYVRDTLNDGLHLIADYVNVDAVHRLMGQYDPENSVESIDLVRDLVTLVSWLRR